MSSKTAQGTASGTRWGAVALGWMVAALIGVVLSPILRLLYGLVSEPPVPRGDLTTALVVVSLAAGFVSYLVGGYVAAKAARSSGGKHGALTAVFGLISGIVVAVFLSLFGVVFAEGVALPPASFGVGGDYLTLAAGLVLFLVNLFGGLIGGRLGEPPPG
jgi:hypothetical protein